MLERATDPDPGFSLTIAFTAAAGIGFANSTTNHREDPPVRSPTPRIDTWPATCAPSSRRSACLPDPLRGLDTATLRERRRGDQQSSVLQLDHRGMSVWTMTAPLTSAHRGDFVELAIPRINEKPSFEGSYAGLPGQLHRWLRRDPAAHPLPPRRLLVDEPAERRREPGALRRMIGGTPSGQRTVRRGDDRALP